MPFKIAQMLTVYYLDLSFISSPSKCMHAHTHTHTFLKVFERKLQILCLFVSKVFSVISQKNKDIRLYNHSTMIKIWKLTLTHYYNLIFRPHPKFAIYPINVLYLPNLGSHNAFSCLFSLHLSESFCSQRSHFCHSGQEWPDKDMLFSHTSS